MTGIATYYWMSQNNVPAGAQFAPKVTWSIADAGSLAFLYMLHSPCSLIHTSLIFAETASST
jgi:hypothetical protein